MAGADLKKVLVVDDMPDNRELFLQYLEDDYEVVEATNGREAIAMAVEHHPDLILMDLSLPEMTGWEATEALKRKDKPKALVLAVKGVKQLRIIVEADTPLNGNYVILADARVQK